MKVEIFVKRVNYLLQFKAEKTYRGIKVIFAFLFLRPSTPLPKHS